MMCAEQVYLTESHGFSDTASGVLYGTFGLLASVHTSTTLGLPTTTTAMHATYTLADHTQVYGLLSGWLIDYLGVKYSLAVGAVLGTIGRFMFAVGSARWVIYTSMFGFMPLSLAFGIPVLTIAIRRYTNNETRTVGFAVFYSVMNISALLAGPATDLCRLLVGSEGIVVFGARLTELRVLFLTSTLASFIMIFVALCGMREVNVDARGEVQEFKPQKVCNHGKDAMVAHHTHTHHFWFVFLAAPRATSARSWPRPVTTNGSGASCCSHSSLVHHSHWLHAPLHVCVSLSLHTHSLLLFQCLSALSFATWMRPGPSTFCVKLAQMQHVGAGCNLPPPLSAKLIHSCVTQMAACTPSTLAW